MNLVTLFAKTIFDALRHAVGSEKKRTSLYFLGLGSSGGAGPVHFREHIGIMNKVAQDRERTLSCQMQSQIDGVAHAETHPQVVGHPNFHCRLLSEPTAMFRIR